jgi:peroxiredoxin
MDDVVVLGIGSDGAYSHREYGTQTNVQFPLLSDSDGRVSRSFGVLADEFDGHREVPKRATFVVDPDRTVQFAWSANNPDDQPDFDALQSATHCRGDSCSIDEADDSVP